MYDPKVIYPSTYQLVLAETISYKAYKLNKLFWSEVA